MHNGRSTFMTHQPVANDVAYGVDQASQQILSEVSYV
jgi:hypothetical protein